MKSSILLEIEESVCICLFAYIVNFWALYTYLSVSISLLIVAYSIDNIIKRSTYQSQDLPSKQLELCLEIFRS